MAEDRLIRVVAIDPGLANVGLAYVESPAQNVYDLLHCNSIETDPELPLLERLRSIIRTANEFTYRKLKPGLETRDLDAILLEDPAITGSKGRRATVGKGSAQMASLNLAFGAIAGALAKYDILELVQVGEWMPRVYTGRLKHIMKHEQTARYVRDRYRTWLEGGDHVTMAAGVAAYWIDQQWRNRKHGGIRSRQTG